MISKEWRDARWKFLVATILVLLLSAYLTPYQDIVEDSEGNPGYTIQSVTLDEEVAREAPAREPKLPPPPGPEQWALNEM